ncbi:MAG: chromosomal replication initiator protein DnaA [Treponema sp.]|nr:chromosomal replication initiator protein DnaA [Treponema sp.]
MVDLDSEGIWKETLNQMRNSLGEEEFSGWFSDLVYLRSNNDNIIIGIPSTFHRDKVKTNYQKIINSTFNELSGKKITVQFEVTGEKQKKSAVSKTVQSETTPKNDEIDKEISKENTKQKNKGKHPQMRDDYIFDRYVIIENNSFAANAAIAISKNPGKAYNPFLIYGGVGLGKTHLMQAIGNYIHDNSDNKVIYITSENFLNEYVQAIQDVKTKIFKNKFRSTDVLLIDDIQFFQDKDRIQEELFHTFNQLLDAKKQLVFTCDRPVSELKKFSERLRSRFELCLKVDLQPPRYEERCAILRSVSQARGVTILDEIIDLICKNVSSNVRDLISSLNTLIAYTELMKEPITIEIAQQRLKNTFNGPIQANLSMDNIIRVVADYFALTPNDLKGKKRTGKIVYPRQIAMYIGREMTDFSTTEIGNEFGGRDHTTVMHSINKVKANLIIDPALESTIESLKRSIKEFSAKY